VYSFGIYQGINKLQYYNKNKNKHAHKVLMTNEFE